MLFESNDINKTVIVLSKVESFYTYEDGETPGSWLFINVLTGQKWTNLEYREDKELRDSDYERLKDALDANNDQYHSSRRAGPVTDPIDQAKFRQF